MSLARHRCACDRVYHAMRAKELDLQGFAHCLRKREAPAHALAFQSLEQQLQCRPVHLLRAHAAPVTDEAPGLQTLPPDAKAAAIKVQTLQLRAATVHKHIQCAIERITSHRMTHQRLKSIVGLPHVCRLTVQVHPDLSFGKEHQLRAIESTSPPPSSRRTSNRGFVAPSPPNSMNGAACALTAAAWRTRTRDRRERPNADRHRRNSPELIPSSRQNTVTVLPLATCRENSSRHVASLRRTRLCVIAPLRRPVMRTSSTTITHVNRTPRAYRLRPSACRP